MADESGDNAPRYGHIRDARGRKVSQLDLIALSLKPGRTPIDRPALGAIVSEKGVRINTLERVAMIVCLLCLVALIVAMVVFTLKGDTPLQLAKRFPISFYFFIWPFIVWGSLRRSRFNKIAPAMLKHRRCPHCGYDIRGLPADEDDGATICPECGCAWRLDEHD